MSSTYCIHISIYITSRLDMLSFYFYKENKQDKIYYQNRTIHKHLSGRKT